MPEGRSVRLNKVKKSSIEKEKAAKRLSDFMEKRKNNRAATMSALRRERLKLNKMSRKDIGK